MMYQMNSPYQPEPNHMYQYDQVPNTTMQRVVQFSPYMQHMPQQMPPLPCTSMSVKSLSTAQQFMPSPMSLNDYHSQSRTPLTNSPQWNIGHQTVVPPLTLDDDMVYNCNFVGQLQGSYEIETPAGQDQVSVIVPTVAEDEKQYAIVRRVCGDGEALPDQFIYQEPTRFTLCSVDGNVEAVLRKGSSMKHTVKWGNTRDGSQTVWRRKGEVTFDLVHADSLTSSRRNSISSVGTASSSVDSPLLCPNGIPIPMRIRPELLQQSYMPPSRPVGVNTSSCGSYVSNDSYQHNLTDPSSVDSDFEQQAMFELIKAHCVENPSMLKKMVHWAMRNRTVRRVTPEDVNNLSEGRLWITAHAANEVESDEIDVSSQESLDDIKGAYRQVRAGVYKQPEPQASEPGVQHRLLKGLDGFWKIESHNVDTGKWLMCAQELPDGRWVDMKNNGKAIRVQLVPMLKILQKLGEGFVSGNLEVEKSMEFLFTSCNQKKLNGKLKGRNMRHNISNLKVKLEKQHALSFAVQVANTADTIAQELEVLG